MNTPQQPSFTQMPDGQWVQNPQPPQAPTPKKNWFARHKILTGLGVFVALGIAVSATGGGQDAATTQTVSSSSAASAATSASATSASAAAASAKPKDTTPGIGTPARDGKFEFTVTKVEKGVASVGDQYVGEKAQGQFVLVHITIKNIGDSPKTMFDNNQSLTDSTGKQYDPNSQAEIAMSNNDVWMQDINPGNSVSGILVYDMPKDAVPASIELHDSMFSGGVKVALK